MSAPALPLCTADLRPALRHPVLSIGLRALLGLALLMPASAGAQAEEGEKAIPVQGGTGRMPKKRGEGGEIKATSGKDGVLKRGKSSSLDPAYDPAQTSRRLDQEPGTEEPVVPKPVRGGKASRAAANDEAPAPPPPESDDEQKIEDLVTFKSNFEKDVKCKRLPLNARVTLDFQEAPIESITKLMSCWMNRNFLIATQKRGGKITILSPQPVSVYEAYRAFLSSLNVNGMAVVKKGDFYHIVDVGDARASGAEVLGPKAGVPADDNIVTRLIHLDHLDAKEVEPILNKFKSKAGDVFVYPPNNTVIVTDSGSNIRRMIKLLADVDVPLGSEKIWIRPVQHMDAAELVEKITAVFSETGGGARAAGAPGAAGPGGGKVVITKAIADERSNQIILVTTRSNYLKIDALIRKLDTPIPGEGQIHIHHLENADAEDLASTLQSLASGTSSRSSGKGAKGGAKPAAGGPGTSAALFEGEVKITAHKATNALVIESSLKDYVSLQKVIAQLDARRKQVYLEAVIMEISTSKNRNVQIAGSGGTTFDIGGDTVPFLMGLGGLGMGGVNLSQLNSGGFAAGLQGPLLSVAAGNASSSAVAGVTLSIPAFGFLIQAIQENSDVNLLSTPHILTLNNEEAEITVGRKVPYRSQTMGGMSGLGALGSLGSTASSALGGLAGLAGLSGMGSTVQYIDVDLTLRITPQINESDFIKLKIEEQLDEVEGIDPNLGPTTSKRKVNNTVVVRDQQPVVIGGLITDRESNGVAKIPILGDLPLLGTFFRKTTKSIEKKNLMLIVVPHIIKDPSDLERMHENKMEQIRDFADELATKRKEYQGKVDYRKKKGFLEHLFQAVDQASGERKMIEKAYFDNSDVDLVGPPDRHDLDYDPFKPASDDGGAQEDKGDDSGVDVIELPDGRPAKKSKTSAKASKSAKGKKSEASKAAAPEAPAADKPAPAGDPAPAKPATGEE